MKKRLYILLAAAAFGLRADANPEKSLGQDHEKKEKAPTWEDILGEVKVQALYNLLRSTATEEFFKRRILSSEPWAIFMKKMGKYDASLNGKVKKDILQAFFDGVLIPYINDGMLSLYPNLMHFSFPESLLEAVSVYDNMNCEGLEERAMVTLLRSTLSDEENVLKIVDDVIVAMKKNSLMQAVGKIKFLLQNDRNISASSEENMSASSEENVSASSEDFIVTIFVMILEKNFDLSKKATLIKDLLRLSQKNAQWGGVAKILKTVSEESMRNLIVNCICEYPWTNDTFSMVQDLFQDKKPTPRQRSKMLNKMIEESKSPETKECKILTSGEFLKLVPEWYGEDSLDRPSLNEVMKFLDTRTGFRGTSLLISYLSTHHCERLVDFLIEKNAVNAFGVGDYVLEKIKESLAAGTGKVTSDQIKRLYQGHFYFKAEEILRSVFRSNQEIDQECLESVAPEMIRYFAFTSFHGDDVAFNKSLIEAVLKRISGDMFLKGIKKGTQKRYSSGEQERMAFMLAHVSLDKKQLEELAGEIDCPGSKMMNAVIKQESFDADVYKQFKKTSQFSLGEFLSECTDDTVYKKIINMCPQEAFEKVSSGRCPQSVLEKYLMYVDKNDINQDLQKLFSRVLGQKNKDKGETVLKIVENLQEKSGTDNLYKVKNDFVREDYSGKFSITLASTLFSLDQDLLPEIFNPWMDLDFTEVIAKNKDSLTEVQKEFVIGQMENPDWILQLSSLQEERAKEVASMLKQKERMEEK